jgi:hypothetical protein
MTVKSLRVVALLAFMFAFAGAMSAHATTVLYRNDGNVGTDYMAQALSTSPYVVTTTTGDLSTFDLSDFDIVVYASQTFPMSGFDFDQLQVYAGAGGHTIFHDWSGATAQELFQTGFGQSDPTSMTVGPRFGAGVSNPVAIVNPGWGSFSQGLIGNAQTITAATFANGDAAILVSLDGRTILNSFLTDTVASPQLYLNELQSFAQIAEAPVPAALPLFASALGGLGFVGWMRRKSAPVAA